MKKNLHLRLASVCRERARYASFCIAVLLTGCLTSCEFGQVYFRSTGYIQTARGWIYRGNNADYELNEIDPSTFTVIDGDYAKDKGHVFYRTYALRNANPLTFVRLNKRYSTDGQHVYTDELLIEDADPKTFHVLKGATGLTVDRAHVYFESEVVAGADPNTLQIVNQEYIMDRDHVFKAGHGRPEIIPAAERQTFKVMAENWGVDARHVFWRGELIPDADPSSLTVRTSDEAFDKRGCLEATRRHPCPEEKMQK